MEVPSMVQRSGNTLIVRSVVSGNPLFVDSGNGNLLKTSPTSSQNANVADTNAYNRASRLDYDAEASPPNVIDEFDNPMASSETKDEGLPQCKIKRNYSCSTCSFFTQNPRLFLTHLRDSHGEKIVINECELCLYASRHYQKLVRHMRMVHGSTEGIEQHSQARKRQSGRDHRKRKNESDSIHPQSTPASPQILNAVEKFEEPITIPDETPQNRLLKCSICEFTTLYRAQLVDHEQDEHYKTKFFRCEKCSYVTHIKARFSKHVKYHSMPMIKCVTCDFRTPYKWNLDRHMKNHGGTGPYKCAACNFTADIKQSLTVHEMNHHVPPVGHAAGMSLARRKNKVGATDIPEELLSENGDLSDPYNNNNNLVDSYEEPYDKKFKMEEDDQPTDLSQKSSMESLKKQARPIPNLIPIQAANNALNLTKTFYEMLHKSSVANSFQSFLAENGEITVEKVEPPQLSPSSSASSGNSKKKSTFFEQLKQNATLNKNESLICDCGHMSKCLSESILHQKSRCREEHDKVSSPSPINLSVNSGSTRCQFCRHRCKSSVDLIAHMKICTDAGNPRHESSDSSSESHEKNDDLNEDINERVSPHEGKHPMENRVFVWNSLPQRMEMENPDDGEDEKPLDGSNKSTDYLSEDQKKENSENSYYGVETAPGYGEVTKKMTPEEEAANSSLKKVYKCPHCSFWASTASRFHVHIVGHLNKKPFECSLCNYRSNWRWDITKHIRLKTIRDPNHKNAKVLMNDETGRRNYTKYNKYITLMKVTEEDGDPKLMKSGEMTPNQEASLSFLNDYKREAVGDYNGGHSEAGSSKNMSPLDTSRIIPMPFFHNSLLGLASQQHEQTKRSPPPLLKASEDILAQNIDVKPDGSDKRTLYKCRKCNYRNANRESVLSHVKQHYQEAGINFPAAALSPHLQAAVNSNEYMKSVLAAMCLSQQQHQLASLGDPASMQNPRSLLAAALPTTSGPQAPQIGSHSVAPSSSHQSLNLLSSSSQRLQHQQQQQLPLTVNHSNNSSSNVNIHRTLSSNNHNNNSNVAIIPASAIAGSSTSATMIGNNCPTSTAITNNQHGSAPNNEHGEAEERHCRLKHNGDIRIETIDRNSDKNMPVYYPLNSQPHPQPSSSSFNNSGNSSNNAAAAITAASPGPSGTVNTNVSNGAGQSQISSSDLPKHKLYGGSFVGLQPTTSSEVLKDSEQEGQASSGGARPRQQQCPLCPFVSESKSQMMYHNSLHKCKADFYQCQICDYICSKKQLLNQHMKIAHEDKPDIEIDLSTCNNDTIGSQALSFCPRCPARYIGSKDLNLHLKMHNANYSHRCGLCSYTALQEPSLLSHSTVHSQSYDEKTTKLLQKFTEDIHYPRPKLTLISLNSDDKVWVVERNTEPDLNESKNPCSEEDVDIDRKPSLLKQQLELNGSDTSSHGVDHPDEYSTKKCPHCPYETSRSAADLKLHLENHICVSSKKHFATCLHCDFSVPDERTLKEHTALHFKSIKNNDVAFYTSYENLELNLVEESDDDHTKEGPRTGSVANSIKKERLLLKTDDAKTNGLLERQIKGDPQSVTSSKDGGSLHRNDDGDNDGDGNGEKQIVVATTGELLKVRNTSSV
ncbi:uncharacterized protein LOC119647229 isoform X3 [Hermetia illucens]|uniref:uncharacterized protein LOC119647229 isoform X3 n=1 Tax=Hermetia illucens TaxID=343691 RepID=UPI0018CC36F3|nr:uncharacterized protein LOC119647229 isoform X3 [Hermetia illucens]